MLAGVVRAEPATDMEAIDNIISYSEKVMEQAEKDTTPEWLMPKIDEKTAKQARELLGGAFSNMRGTPGVGPSTMRALGGQVSGSTWEKKNRVAFMSMSIPQAKLKELLIDAREQHIIVIFRGIPRGERLTWIQNRIRKVMEGEAPPGVVLDPSAFKRAMVTQVPTYLYPKEGGAPVRVIGSSAAPEWVESASAIPGSTTVLGPTYEIDEPDLIEELQRRMAAIDWEAKKKEMMANYWRRLPFVDLPEAGKPRSFTYDPSIVVTKNIEHDGVVLAKAGTRVNPLDHLQLSKKIVAFDARIPWQMEWVKQYASKETKAGHNLILITSGLDRERGFKHMDEIYNATKRNIYLMTTMDAKKLHLEALPSVIEQEGKLMKVTEVARNGS